MQKLDPIELMPTHSIIAPDEPAPFEVINPHGDAPAILICDHASNRIPRSLRQLGVSDEVLQQHVAYDLGSAAVARQLSKLMNAPLWRSNYSRMIIDCNRFPDDPTSIPAMSDGIAIPGNQQLTDEKVTQRAEEFFYPYHEQIAAGIDAKQNTGVIPVMVSVHSFTPFFAGHERPWHVGVLWGDDGRIAQPLIHRLRRYPHLCIGDNEPYNAREPVGYSMITHGEEPGLPHLLLEIRQDLITDREGIDHWASFIHGELKEVLTDPEIFQLRSKQHV